MKRFLMLLISVPLIFLTSACQTTHEPHAASAPCETSVEKLVISPIQEERDNIYSLLAYAVVLSDWQQEGDKQRRGHNIGSVLVDENGKVVYSACNSNKITRNGTQHGEVRLMIGYLDKIKTTDLRKHTIYTNLEPCAMCSGMMTLQKIQRTVYGQADPDYGKAIERLELDSHHLPNGFCPYPRGVVSDSSKTDAYKQLNAAFEKKGGSITDFLLTDEAKKIHENARIELLAFKVSHSENEAILKDAIDFLNNKATCKFQP